MLKRRRFARGAQILARIIGGRGLILNAHAA
jgi:hypothetical protein